MTTEGRESECIETGLYSWSLHNTSYKMERRRGTCQIWVTELPGLALTRTHQFSPPVPWPGLDVSWNLQCIRSNVTTESPHLECGLDVCYSPWRWASLLCLVWWWHQNSLKAIFKKNYTQHWIRASMFFPTCPLSPSGDRRRSISLWGFKSA